MAPPFKPSIKPLGKEIQDARRSSTSYEEILSKTEENLAFKVRKIRRNPGASVDWDRDF
jgi:hypothetical protein